MILREIDGRWPDRLNTIAGVNPIGLVHIYLGHLLAPFDRAAGKQSINRRALKPLKESGILLWLAKWIVECFIYIQDATSFSACSI